MDFDNILFREEIASSLLKVAGDDKVVLWDDLINDLKEFIVGHYDGKSMNVFKGDWKRRIKIAAKQMTLTLDGENKYQDAWRTLEEALNAKVLPKASTKSSTDSNYRLSEEEKSRALQQYNNIVQEHKWTLSTGTVVNEQMKQLVSDSIYEHPVHSMIIDPSDIIWRNYFTAAEILEIKTHAMKPLQQLPQELADYLDLYDRNWETATDLYKYADNQKHDPITEFDKKWVRESLMRAAELFFYSTTLDTKDTSESDLLHDVWPFVYRAFKDQKIKAMLGERCSVAVALGRNEDRTLEAVDKRQRKVVGAKVDTLFKLGTDELGTCEVGKDHVIIADDKYLNDGLIKLPKTLRDMLAVLVQKNPAKVNQLSTIGYLMMGLDMELVVMDCPVGTSICRVSKTPKLRFPSSLSTITLDLLPLLEVTWKGKNAMMSTVSILNDRKRKAVELSAEADNTLLLPYSFVRRSSI